MGKRNQGNTKYSVTRTVYKAVKSTITSSSNRSARACISADGKTEENHLTQWIRERLKQLFGA